MFVDFLKKTALQYTIEFGSDECKLFLYFAYVIDNFKKIVNVTYM